MQRILITEEIRGRAQYYAKKIKTAVPNVCDDLLQLKSDITLYGGTKLYDKYIDEIISDYPALLTAEPRELVKYAKKYSEILSENDLKAKIAYGVYLSGNKAGQNRKKKFNELIIGIMGYSKARSILIPIYTDMGIRTCVYCNAQYAIGTKNGKGMYELDHLLPESINPALCTSFFNLQPSCASCNNSKRDKDLDFFIYTDNPNELNPFHLLVNWNRYNPTYSYKSLSIDFVPNDIRYVPLKNKFEKYFSIHGIYEMHRDVAEETIWRLRCYDKRYVEMFKKRYGPIFSKDALYRYILGVHEDKMYIFSRPLSKLIHDLKEDIRGVCTDYDSF